MSKSEPDVPNVEARQAPYYDEKTQIVIVRFLAACSIDARRAYESSRQMATPGKHGDAFAAHANYWKNLAAGCKWLAWRARCKQIHLLAFDDSEIQELIKEWQSQPKT